MEFPTSTTSITAYLDINDYSGQSKFKMVYSDSDVSPPKNISRILNSYPINTVYYLQ